MPVSSMQMSAPISHGRASRATLATGCCVIPAAEQSHVDDEQRAEHDDQRHNVHHVDQRRSI